MRAASVTLRVASAADHAELGELFRASVLGLGPSRYEPEQVQAWAAFADCAELSSWLEDAWIILATDGKRTLGFAGLAAGGHVTALYVLPEASRHGLGSALLRAVLAEAERQGHDELRAEASHLSRPLFERQGFRVVEVERLERDGVTVERFRMTRGS